MLLQVLALEGFIRDRYIKRCYIDQTTSADSSIEEVLTLAHEFTRDIEISEAPLFIQRLSVLADVPHRAQKGGDVRGMEGGAKQSMRSEDSESRVKRPSTQLSMLGDAGNYY